ncbi:hypothetical protein LCGC14_0140610 [marine sediment metagenome]|uniref:Uncharacterized protein n=1 Tax=marine sediment metagenome TaxID=412755 RepID=A0A0F9V0T0_9ZZZZ
MDKSVAMGVHTLDQSIAYLSELIGDASTIDSEAVSTLLAALLPLLRAIGFTPSEDEESKEAVDWIKQHLDNSDNFIYLLSACAYCGLLSAMLANAQVGDVEPDTE